MIRQLEIDSKIEKCCRAGSVSEAKAEIERSKRINYIMKDDS